MEIEHQNEEPEIEKELIDAHQEALALFDDIQGAVKDEREQCLEDRRFASINGAQWEGPLGEDYENKVKVEVNKVRLAVRRVINEYRNNRLEPKFINRDGVDDDDASIVQGLYRADAYDSNKNEANDMAANEAIAGGYGAFRLSTCYENEFDENDDKQRIVFEPIPDADSCVFFDLSSTRQDKMDAKHCFVLTGMTPQAYEEEYGEFIAPWPKSVDQHEFDWSQPELVYIAEYYKVIVESVRVTTFYEKSIDENGQEVEIEKKYTAQELRDDPKIKETILALGGRKGKTRKVKRQKVHKYIMSGDAILEDCGVIAGKYIPVVPVYGEREVIDGVERAFGITRFAKDAQRLKNMVISRLAEIAAAPSLEKPIFTAEQIAGHEETWAADNVEDYAYQLVNSIEDQNGNLVPTGPVGYTKVPQIPPALGALIQQTDNDLTEVLGRQEAGEEMHSNISGVTVELIQNKLDMQTFLYMSNIAKAEEMAGRIYVEMARDIYTEKGRKMRSMSPDGKISMVELRTDSIDDEGKLVEKADLSKANFDVWVEVGPSSSSKKASNVRAFTQMLGMTDNPEDKAILQAAAMMNMEGEGVVEIGDFYRKRLVQMGVMEPSQADIEAAQKAAEAQEQQPPTAQDQYFQAAAKKEETEAVENMANAQKIANDAELSRVKAVEILEGIEADKVEQILKIIQATAAPKVSENQF